MHRLVHAEQVFGYCRFQTHALIFIDLNRGSHAAVNAALVVHSTLGKAVCCMLALLLLMWDLPSLLGLERAKACVDPWTGL